MKKTCLLLLLSIFLLSSYAQKPFAGIIKSKTYVENTTDANILSQFPINAETTVLNNKVKSEMVMQGLGITTISDGDKMLNTIILDMTAFGMGSYYKTTPVDFSKTKVDFTMVKEDTKVIAGYTCYKVVAAITNLETDDVTTANLYISDDFMPTFISTQYFGLKGYPLYTSSDMDTGGVTYTVINEITEIKANKKIKDVDFLLPASALSFDEAPDEVKAMLGDGDED
ncbi:MAG: hypothetical protein LBU51_10590 [Bacteroidales bacterium]|jgi:hypothetical protein|nr:hypothetical protein [Bacteroidales bacterium]